jgi:PAS domain S-box-containing protein
MLMILRLFERLFVPDEFMPHGHCYLWNRGLITLHVTSDVVIGISYVVIAMLLWRLVRRIQLPFSPLFLAFGIFILACGLTHFMEVWTLWVPSYWLAGGIKALTAIASISTAIALVPVRARSLQLVQAAASLEAHRTELEAKTKEIARLSDAAAQEANARLRESEDSYRALVDNLPQMAFSGSPNGDIDFYNRGWYEYTGTTFEQLKGWGWETIQSPEFLPAVLERWKHALKAGEPFEMEFPLKAKDGTYRWFLTRVQPLKNSAGQVLRWFGTNTDVENKRKEEAALRTAIEIRDTFLSVATHELKTPLTALALSLDSLERVSSSHWEAEYVERVRRSAGLARRQLRKLTDLVNDLLDVSRISSGQFSMELTVVDVVALVRECISRFETDPNFVASQTEIRLEVGPPAQMLLRTARLRLEQVITNLLDNAAKYGPGKPIEVRIRVDHQRLMISVTDHGIGIEPQLASQIFERFGRGVSDRNYGGLGLGLYISRTIVEGLGGTIRMQSVPREGSTFTVELPTIADASP